MLRVVQWATGQTGGLAARAVLAHPDLELVGALVYGPDKAGRDVGEILGVEPTGVIATTDRDEIRALDADCVLYMPQGEYDPAGTVDEICTLLASGKNVVSTAVTALIYPAAMGSSVAQKLATACAEGNSSFHATGIEPGWASEVLPLAMSPLFRRIDRLLVREVLDYSAYASTLMLFHGMGFGQPTDSPANSVDPAVPWPTFTAPLMLVADALGAVVDEFVGHREVVLAERGFDVAAGHVAPGTVAGIRFGATAVIGGRAAMTVEHVTRIHPDVAPDWPTGHGWQITVDGSPSITLEAKIVTPPGSDHNTEACLGTAMHAVHSVAPVCAAAPGIRTFLDLPTIVGRHAFG